MGDGNERRGASENDWTEPHEHNVGAAGAPGASAPGEPGYEGDVQISSMGADADAQQYGDQFGRPDTTPPEDL